jgi:predicted esterase
MNRHSEPSTATDPHAGQPVLSAGPSPGEAAATLILLHGRGASAQSMLELHRALGLQNLAALAPQAASFTWYPQSFLAPLDANQPYLDSALGKVDAVVSEVLSRGVASERVALLGFSQGACLTCEYVARHPRRYGAVMALTGGLIGPPGMAFSYSGSLDGTPVFLGTSDPDAHVPVERVLETQEVLSSMNARVELRRYADMPHTINQEELDACRALLQSILGH